MTTRSALKMARVVNVSMWGHWKTQKSAENLPYQIRQGCLDGYFSNIPMSTSDESWTMFRLTAGCWDYRKPYVQEIVDMFTPFFGDDGVYIHEVPEDDGGPRVVYRLRRGMQKEVVHAFNVFLRYSWGNLHQWPVQSTPPDAKTVWQAHLDSSGWDKKSLEDVGYITHSNFCSPSSMSRFVGFESQNYVDIMYSIMSNGMQKFPWSSYAQIPKAGSVTMKRYVFTMAITEYAQAHHKETGKEFDPFD